MLFFLGRGVFWECEFGDIVFCGVCVEWLKCVCFLVLIVVEFKIMRELKCLCVRSVELYLCEKFRFVWYGWFVMLL